MYIGFDIGGTNLAIALVNDDYEIIARDKMRTGASRGTESVVGDILTLCDRICEAAGVSRKDIRRVGLGCPGAIEPGTGKVVFSGNLPLGGVPLRDIVAEHWSVPVTVENDANCAALGEALAGAARGVGTSALITLGTGVGSGIVIDRKIYRGFNGAGGEIGHSVIVEGGRPCTCGRLGCWEAYSSATGLVRMTREAMLRDKGSLMWELSEGNLEKAGGRTSFKAARAGDRRGIEVVGEYVKYLACGITNVINIFQPEVICIGGGVCNEGAYLLDPVMEIVNRDRYAKDMVRTEVKIAELGNDAGIIGAAFAGA